LRSQGAARACRVTVIKLLEAGVARLQILPCCRSAPGWRVVQCTCLSSERSAEVGAMVAKAVASEGKVHREPQDHGFMYAHGFEDLDGHIWELAYMPETPPQ